MRKSAPCVCESRTVPPWGFLECSVPANSFLFNIPVRILGILVEHAEAFIPGLTSQSRN